MVRKLATVMGRLGVREETKKHIPFLNAIDLKINPPYAWNAQHYPQGGLFAQGSDGQPLEHTKVGEKRGYKKRQPHTEEEDVEWKVHARGLGGDR